VRSQYQQGPLGATTMQSNRKAETRMNAVSPSQFTVDLIYVPEKYGMTWDILNSLNLHKVTTV